MVVLLIMLESKVAKGIEVGRGRSQLAGRATRSCSGGRGRGQIVDGGQIRVAGKMGTVSPFEVALNTVIMVTGRRLASVIGRCLRG